ncbi:hypothetical protein A8B79_02415 [Balneola sp. EhC07]|uniref:hypothetical protein n=1 Tax=Balneola sp. EhC07 TaxID=1849360 RepID=UPI0007F420DF|nr:hypothetical protein [Balneola sp. EhC07]OAN62425.1 hypothetical protein A8B79_02415 [Balneola sp. EhC07]
MNRPIKILFLDDEVDDLLPDITLVAKQNRVIIKKAISNFEEGNKYIRKHYKDIDAIILDGFFHVKQDSSDKKDIRALKETVDELTKLLYREKIRIPFCVLTGYLEDLSKDSLLSNIKVFKKGGSFKEMFDYLKKQVANNEDYQIKSEYNEIFELFDKGLLPDDKEEDLVEILKKVNSKAKYNDDAAFTPIRKMYEAMVNEMHDQAYNRNKNQDIVPAGLYDRADKLSISWSWFYLSGYDVKQGNEVVINARSEAVWPSHIANLSKMMIEITQEGSHDYPEDVHHYAYKSTVFALLELLLWYKEFMQNYS